MAGNSKKSGNQPEAGVSGTVRTQSALAVACHVTEKTISTWRKEPGFPVNSDGSFSIWDVAKWHSLRYPSPAESQQLEGFESGGGSPALEKWRLCKANLAGLELRERLGQLIQSRFVMELFALLGSRLRELGDRFQKDATASPYELLTEALGDIEQLMQAWISKHMDSKQ